MVNKPKINIEQISDGVGISAVITNTGDVNATNVVWNINLDGFVLFRRRTSDIIPNLAVGESVEIYSGIPFGIGAIDITINAACAEGPYDIETASGRLFLFFINVIE